MSPVSCGEQYGAANAPAALRAGPDRGLTPVPNRSSARPERDLGPVQGLRDQLTAHALPNDNAAWASITSSISKARTSSSRRARYSPGKIS
jgi:hypothetical protein